MAITPVILTGYEQGLISVNGGGLATLINVGVGSITIDSSVKKTGARSLKIVSPALTAEKDYVNYTVPSSNLLVASFDILYNAWPGTSTTVSEILCTCPSGSDTAIGLDISTKKLAVWTNHDVTTRQLSANALSLDTWYHVDVRFTNTGSGAGGTITIDWYIDDVLQTQYYHGDYGSPAWTTLNIGPHLNDVTATVLYFDNFVYSNTSADFPIGRVYIIGSRPNADGTHDNPNTDVIEDGDGNRIDGSTNYAYDHINENPWTGTYGGANRIQQTAVDGGARYVEVQFEDITEENILGVSAWLEYAASNIVAGATAGCVIRDSNGQETTVWGDGTTRADYTESSCFYKRAIVATPSGGWTKDHVNALRARLGYADVVTYYPYWQALMLEVAYGPETKTLAGTVSATSGVTGILRRTRELIGTSTVTSSISGVLKRVRTIKSIVPDVLDEGFEKTKPTNNGYDNSGWSETIGSGSIVNSDCVDVQSPAGGGHVFKYQKVSPNYNAVSNKVITGSSYETSYTTFLYRLKAFTSSFSTRVCIAVFDDSAYASFVGVNQWRDGSGNLKFEVFLYNNGASGYFYSTSNLSLDTWYLVGIKYDHVNHKVSIRFRPIGGVDEYILNDVALIGTHKSGIYYIRVGDSWNSKTIEAFIDSIKISSMGWPEGICAASAVSGSLTVTVEGEGYWTPAGTIAGVSSVTGSLKRIKSLSGSISGVSSITGSLAVSAAAKVLAGTVDAVSSVIGSLKRVRSLSGSISAVSGITGSSRVVKEFVGSISGVSSLIGDVSIQGKVYLSGSISAVSGVAGKIETTKRFFGTCSSAALITGSLKAVKEFAGVIGGVSSVSGDLGVAGQATLIGSISAVSGVTGSLKVFKKFFGTSTPVASFVGQLRRTREVAGVISSASSITGSAKRIKRILGTSASLSSVSGKIENTRRLFGVVSAVSSITGGLATQGKVDLYGTISAVSSVTGLLRVRKEVAGAVGVVSSCAGVLKVQRELASSIASQSVITGRPEVSRKLVGAIGVVSSVTGFAKIGKEFVGAVSGVSLITGRPEISRKLVGAVNAVSSISGVWHSTKEFKGVIAAQTVVSGVLRKFFPLSGSIASVSSVTGYLKRLREIAGSISGVVDINGYLVSGQEVRLRGPINAVSTVSGKFNVDYSLFGVINAVSSVVGTTKLLEEIAGRIDAISVISGTPRVTRPLAGAFSASSSIVGYIQHVFRYVLKVFIRKVTRIFNRVETKKILDRKEKKRIFIGGPYGD